MIQTHTPQPERMSFWEACKLAGVDGSDICDRDWDWGIFLGIPEAKSLEECEDGYDRFCLLLALNLHCTELRTDWYTVCDVCDFIEANRKAFDRFLEEANREGYRPSDYEGHLNANEDKGYYEVYMQSMECLIAGNYALEDYEKLIRYILEDNA